MSSILFEIKNGVAFITLNRPDKFNSFNREMAFLLQGKLDEAGHGREVGFALPPAGLEVGLTARVHLEVVHGDKHADASTASQRVLTGA